MSPLNLTAYLKSIVEVEESDSLRVIRDKIQSGEKVYILLSGGFGSGKSYVVENLLHIPKENIVDIDEIKKTNKAAVRGSIDAVDRLIKNKTWVIVHQGTSANLKATIKKIEKAKENGYITILLNVYRDLDIQVKSLFKRGEETGRGYEKDDPSLSMDERFNKARSHVEFKNQKVKEVLDAVKDLKSLDYIISYHNEV